jgi:hypothetical protein
LDHDGSEPEGIGVMTAGQVTTGADVSEAIRQAEDLTQRTRKPTKSADRDYMRSPRGIALAAAETEIGSASWGNESYHLGPTTKRGT